MPTGTKLRNRLTLWSFVLLSMLLGVGGFFCYNAHQQEQLRNLDRQLLFIARNFACSYREVAPLESVQSEFCSDFNRLAIHQAGAQAIALYSAEGKILCSNRHPVSHLLQLDENAQKNSSTGKAYFETLNDIDEQKIRRLTFPVIQQDQAFYHLQLGHPLDQLEAELAGYGLILTAIGLSFACLLTLAQWLFLGSLFSPIQRLSIQMDETSEENLRQRFRPPFLAGAEIQQLAASYNGFTERITSILKRSRQFATDVTHELRTPLTIMRGETELALRGDKTAEELKQVLNSNLEELSRMGHLVDDLLLLSKSELGEIPLKMEALNLNGLLEELHFHGTIIAEPKQITVNLKGPEKQVSLFADANRIRQVFLNLLTNGIKYTPEGGSVTIDWTVQEETARIIFQDTGIGIDSEHQQHIFDRFYRINKTGNRNDGGSGLGLAIAKWLVEAHGGSIMVCSVPGEGSSFAITLPLTHKPDK
ncbi:Signal transduction histidine kinase [Malonomonas rubra DSM 5091]|uniref:histidine kinase n=1 Tax=Malonomonas rubra DSM 5091 TaxID=1122189 RepID=A0A1M6FH52_MALRU|nr:HAMP domain-containing sensor histidine kinase [Malonomonas rubra]SHI97030.1 Signal transduction histidine kinase [Malonomonas rubra DSM 5091]